ncbi:LTA synthase family protein [Priestia taiwanensis]|uniref:Phosphoglycerol transferase n=1 Tax=Priestia taiwanensis TaxID=1347902 RepID=A0A917ASX5_9BACI|nr:LTA synthase family protein [Priestia taiwanensis]MBM7363111.1 phosphoglycerol transferase MdoB-like AlkP superfamily enzyme [Priestia taiwanensis]GGE67768.1 phosphoglycerol transferase [Priestia taiwanensis]
MLFKKKQQEKKQRSPYLFVFLLPLITMLLVELIQRGGSVVSLGIWLGIHPKEWLVTYVLIFGVFSIFLLISVRAYMVAGIILSIPLCGFAAGSAIKQAFRGEPLLPADFLLTTEAGEVTSYVPTFVWILIPIILILVVMAVRYVWKTMGDKKIHFGIRAALGILGLVSVFLLVNEEKYDIQGKLGLGFVSYDQRASYESAGLYLAFIDNIKHLHVPEPAGYNKETIENLVPQTAVQEVVKKAPDTPDGRQPNVIVVMSEAFSDPTELPGVTYSEDPLPNFHALQKEHLSGKMNVSVFGGGTANSEFEVITGMSAKYVPSGVMPYIHYVNRPLPSIAWQFREAGYDATAMTPWHSWFYKIKDVYKNLGFNRLDSLEFYQDPETAGGYVKDKELVPRIADQVKNQEKPAFIYAVTMEGHGPYPDNKDIGDITAEGLKTESSKNIVEYFANTMHSVDQSIKQLTDELSAIDEPTIVVYFGDHRPSLGAGEKVYDEVGMGEKPGDYASYKEMYNTPMLIWDNYSGQKGDLSLTTSFLGQYLLDRAGVEGNTMSNFLHEQYVNGVNFLPSERWLDAENFSREKMDEYKMLQYDILHGNQYAVPSAQLPNPEGFHLGIKGPEIEKIEEKDGNIIVTGSMFTKDTKVVIDGKEVDTTYENPTTLTVSASKVDSGKHAVTLHLLDSQKIKIFTSKPYSYEK